MIFKPCMPELTCACNKTQHISPEAWERIRAFLLRYHGPKEVTPEELRAVLAMPADDDQS